MPLGYSSAWLFPALSAMVPEAVRASDELLQDGFYANVVNCTSPDLVYRSWQDSVTKSLEAFRIAPVGAPGMSPS